MPEPIWIRSELVLLPHQIQLAEHGGTNGIRDIGLLESALARPENLWAYSDPKPDLASLAASYAHGIAKNHPFVDGNKRTALVVTFTFLIRNGFNIRATENECFEVFLGLAAGTVTEEALACWLREHLSR